MFLRNIGANTLERELINVYTAQMVVNHTSGDKLELYDIKDITKGIQSGNKLIQESADGLTKVIRHPKDVYVN